MLEFSTYSFSPKGFDPFDIDVITFDKVAQYAVVSCCTFRETWRVLYSFNRSETVARAKYFTLWALCLELTGETLPAFMDAGATSTLY